MDPRYLLEVVDALTELRDREAVASRLAGALGAAACLCSSRRIQIEHRNAQRVRTCSKASQLSW